ncbi:B3 domain-containing protein Os07g0563300-like isoform X2 [Macadamia integrifolia]|uniref:B3 domain-containing protein Os07g0563300-like isoform X2 n=1 Tax=Macadamia integrifolia TaxID=60698 RepID=UPI001C4E6F15|nr:B3 domain-containing protein Os07g0563300-like isoform X2 [Macadamia integrifolia]
MGSHKNEKELRPLLMSSSSSSVKIGCFNSDCEAKPERSRKGWRLRNGQFAELCDRCASAYEGGRFCETFHLDAAGWRSCESCGKRVHCGCIVSFHAVALLDAGGVECLACANKNFIRAPNPVWPSPFFLHLPLPERLKDLSVKNWNQFAGSSAVAAQWRHAPSLWNTATALSELHPRMPYEIDRSNGIDKLVCGERPSASAMEKSRSEDPSERVVSSSLKFVPPERVANGNAGDDIPVETKKGVIVEPGKNTPAAGINYEAHPSVNMSVQSTPKDDMSPLHVDFSLPHGSHNETNGPSNVSGPQSQPQMPPSAIAKPLMAGPHNGVESSVETLVRNGRPRGDTRGRHQLLPRYWPRITDQELQQISGDSNSVITPLFEKMLSASDAGRIGRLVLPKKCAEAYFPAISQPEGLPLKVQDARGKEWVFQFRFWPNNNSRMYVLEGVTPCIQSMQLQAGDTVTFSRIDPEGKLVMGFRKASNIPPSDQEMQTPKSGNGVPKNGEANLADPSVWSKVDKSGYIAKEIAGAKASLPTKRKSSTLGSKSKRLRIENEDLIELKVTWEEAQELLRPPPDFDPNVVMIEGQEIEEYVEAPIIGKPTIFTINQLGLKIQWVQCEDCSKWRKLPFNVLPRSKWTCSKNSWDPKRSTCSSPQELTTEQLEDLLSSKSTAAPKKTKATKQVTEAVEASEGLDTLANLAILGEGEALLSSSQATTKHPRHRPGCSCIVCIQPPSGKGPKHKQTCTCNVCLTVRRRFRTLMLRREKRQSEKEAETARKKEQQLHQSPKAEPEDDDPLLSSNTSNSSSNPKQPLVNETVDDENLNSKKPSSSPLKGQIDLNIQPEREDEPSPTSDSCSMRLIRDATERYLRGQRQSSSGSDGDPITDQIEPGRGGVVEERLDGVPCGSVNLDGDMEHPVTLSMPMSTSTSTSATG